MLPNGFDSARAASRFNTLAYGTVMRHRLFSDQNGRWLEFTLVEGDRRTPCRWKVDGEVSRQFIHGLRYAVMGRRGDDEKQVFEVTRAIAIGHVAPRSTLCRKQTNRRQPARHAALVRRTGLANEVTHRAKSDQ